ncbi:uncharacterized protein B0I36DRAFT_13933 [Microdochium trichocladiopsis]|uniref:Uncharacterized protein n=1 Tax=Microdochium trichocladiopsis TaxID=1682393 RepID=A0A9P8YIR8_9PEZI|nr:uncharacterized protein B0I36DRAFT_13933 [Microdochium trichocladiopsis]KAH7040683.1 hypothetical protein B0I36DRAFT_13933 [Microdochium trichocladiopsis]
MKLHLLSLAAIAGLLPTFVNANTEKTIFLGPPTVNVPSTSPTLGTLGLDVLTPESSASSIIRTQLNASFPRNSPYLASFPSSSTGTNADGTDNERGTTSWFILDNLVPGQRYEVRVCWAATQPTAFKLETFPIDTVFDTPDLISSLSTYSYARHASGGGGSDSGNTAAAAAVVGTETQRSVLFLRIVAAADYFTLDKALMTHVPPVRVDVILDPFLLNVLPRSLLPIVGYIVVVAISSWFLAKYIATTIRFVALQPEQEKKTL